MSGKRVKRNTNVMMVSQPSQSLLGRFNPIKTKLKEQEIDIRETIGGYLVADWSSET
jgi:hypothetical protein